MLAAVSQIAGRMIPPIAAQLLQNNEGGHGILLGGVPGVPPVRVVILGAGIVGSNAARHLLARWARTSPSWTPTCHSCRRWRRTVCKADTMVAYDFNVARAVKRADVLVGAVLVPGARTPHLVTREMVRTMKPRSVIMDVAIDQGGCVETSRPTTYQNPTYIEEGVIHYCVPNMTGVVARTTTHAFNNAAWPYIREDRREGAGGGARERTGRLRRGLNMHDGEIVHPGLARCSIVQRRRRGWTYEVALRITASSAPPMWRSRRSSRTTVSS